MHESRAQAIHTIEVYYLPDLKKWRLSFQSSTKELLIGLHETKKQAYEQINKLEFWNLP